MSALSTARDMKKPSVSIVDMTPETAGALLAKNTKNRKVRSQHVAYLSHLIRSGQWVVNNDAIAVSDDGTLLNGQHRLTAIAESGVTVPVLLMSETSVDVGMYMDDGLNRTSADRLSIMGITNAAEKASLARMILDYNPTSGPGTGHTKFSVDDLRKVMDTTPFFEQALTYKYNAAHTFKALRNRANAFAFWLLLNANDREFDTFFYRVTTGAELSMNSPELTLRNFIVSVSSDASTRSSRAWRTKENLFMYGWVTAWNAYMTNRSLKIIRVTNTWPTIATVKKS